MNPHQQLWLRLATTARRAPDDRDAAAPYGFGTRVAALGLAAPAALLPRALLEKFALRGLLAAGALSVAAIVFGYTAFDPDLESDFASNDSVTEVLAQS
jgi:hypothetical protein